MKPAADAWSVDDVDANLSDVQRLLSKVSVLGDRHKKWYILAIYIAI